MATATHPLPAACGRRPGAGVTSIARAAARTVIVSTLLMAAGACGGNGRELGESCDTTGECSDDLQCLAQVCVPRCQGHIDCGDGAVCAPDGECRVVTSEVDDPCFSELDCGVGQTCRLSELLGIAPGSCQLEVAGGLEGEACAVDGDCRMGGCALGRCVSLCREDDCRRGWLCAAVPLPARSTSQVNACLPGNATIEFAIDVPAPDPLTGAPPVVRVPVPSTARSMVLVFEAASSRQRVGAGLIQEQGGREVYHLPELAETYYANPVRHAPQPGVSVLQIPSSTAAPLRAGIYTVSVLSFLDDPTEPASGRPRLRVVEKLGTAARLDVHFYFLDLGDHPCEETIGADLSATSARALSGFQQEYLGEIGRVFQAANINLGEVTYDDISGLAGDASGRPELDVLAASQAPELFRIPTRPGGVSVFFVRAVEPDGQQLVTGGTPGAPMPGTGASGIAIATDTLCYRSWTQLARQTAHGIARHMGLFRNREPDDVATHVDPIADSDESLDNLMHWSEFGGTALSEGQRKILQASPVLR